MCFFLRIPLHSCKPVLPTANCVLHCRMGNRSSEPKASGTAVGRGAQSRSRASSIHSAHSSKKTIDISRHWPQSVSRLMADGTAMPSVLQRRLERADACGAEGNVCQFTGPNRGYVLTDKGWAFTEDMQQASDCDRKTADSQRACWNSEEESENALLEDGNDGDLIADDRIDAAERKSNSMEKQDRVSTGTAKEQSARTQVELSMFLALGFCLALAYFLHRQFATPAVSPEEESLPENPAQL